MIRRSVILDTLVDLILRTALVFAVFLLFTGHNAPGGGFVGGLVAGTALILRYVAGGRDEVLSLWWMPPEVTLGVGLSISILTGAMGWVWGSAFLQSAEFAVDVPVLGTVKATSALSFDIGVFVIVLGLAAALIDALGEEEGEPL